MSKAATKFRTFKIIDSQPSGFVLNGTADTPNETRIDYAERFYILGESTAVDKSGVRESIRYIAGCDTLSVKEQEERKIAYNPKDSANRLFFDKNYMRLDEVEHKVLISFMERSFNNANAEGRPDHHDPIWFEVKEELAAESYNDSMSIVFEAQSLLYPLRKKVSGGYEFNEDKMNAYVKALGIESYDDEPQRTFSSLLIYASRYPVEFTKVVGEIDNTIVFEVEEAWKLKVFDIQDGAVLFAGSEKVVKHIGEKKNKQETISLLADFFMSDDGKEVLQDMRKQVLQKKEQNLKNK